MISAPQLYLNDIDTSRYGFILDNVEGIFDQVERTDVTTPLPQGAGVLLSTAQGRLSPRTIVLHGTVYATTRAGLETAKDSLKVLGAAGLVGIRLVSRDIAFRGRLAGMTATHFSPQLRDGRNAARVSLRFLCPDPFGWDRLPRMTGFLSTPVPLSLGTAPSRGRSWWGAVITIQGPATTPTLTEYDAGGNVLRTMAFTWSPTASDQIEIDVGRGTVTRVQSGARDNGLPYLSAGFGFPQLDPADGYYLTSAFPQLGVSSGVGIARYYRSWL